MDFPVLAVCITAFAGIITGYANIAIMEALLDKRKFHFKLNKKINLQYLFIILLNVVLYVLIVLIRGVSAESFIYCALASALLLLSIIDFKTYEIPFGINVFIFFLGLVRLLLDLPHWYEYVIGFFAVSLVLYLIVLATKGRGMGGGDVKLMAAAGFVTGWKLIWVGLIFGCILGSVIHLIRMRVEKKKEPVLAFGPYLSMGIYIAVLFGNDFIAWYLRMCGVRGY